MEYIGKDEALLGTLSGDLSLLSSKLSGIHVSRNDESEVVIELYLELLYAKQKNSLKLVFKIIKEFSFYYNQNYNFYNVERYKFFKEGEDFYISLDPNNEDDTISSEDQDFILSKHVEGFLLEAKKEVDKEV